jgi:23S rRNA (cytosine1962-C5)-methyltransferase
MVKSVVIRPERTRPLLGRHPWVFSGAVESVRGSPEPGDLVDVVSKSGEFLARGYFNPRSQIQVRLLTWHDEPIDEAWWRRMLARAMTARLRDQRKQHGSISAYRVVNAESDYLPGLIIDRCGSWYVLQALTLGIEVRKEMLARLLRDVHAEFYPHEAPDIAMRGVYERSDVDVRKKEGLPLAAGVLWGEPPSETVEISEESLRYHVDVRRGHKTGFYLDQRINRALLRDFMADDVLPAESGGHRVLNLFSYTGGFGAAALRGSIRQPGQVINVDSSRDALELAERNFHLNFVERQPESERLNLERHAEFLQADVFDLLRDFVNERQRFDAIICDPPKFAHNAGQVERALRGYKDLNLNCFRLLNPGGCLMTFSCSGAIDAEVFHKVVASALADSGRDAQIIGRLSAGDDHPVALTFPEGAYLKGLFLRVW